MSWGAQAIFFLCVFILAWGATGLVIPVLRRRAILDHPGHRSSHAAPTPRGGGWAVVTVALAAWGGLILTGLTSLALWPLPALALALAGLSWLDDLSDLPPLWRLLAQAAAIAMAFLLLPRVGPFFGGLLPPILDLAAAGLLWLWFVNLFNFMDGIDGITAVETLALGLGTATVATLGNAGPEPALGLALAAAALGFAWWNWQPARVFLGDVGSVPLGFLLGWLLLDLAAAGQWAAALILPLYYLADATLTLVRRALRGERVWRAHREHFYQRAVQRGAGHGRVAGAVFLVNAALIALALLAATGLAWPALVAAFVLVGGFLVFLDGGAGIRPSAGNTGQ